MYLEHFGLKHPPFKITPDTSLFYPGGNRGTVLEALVYAITSGEGIIKVVGEVGSGKTMLCRMLELELPGSVEIVYLANPRLSPDNILHVIAFELKLPVTETDNRLLAMRALQNYLLERHAENRQVVIFVEEAQSMPLATLEEIRLLSNLETSQHKLLQMVLFGQPELDDQLARPQIRQLRERITHHFNLSPLTRTEIAEYLNARLRSCGYRGASLFSPTAITLITRYSKGLLRRVNILADKAMLAAYADNKRRIGRRQVMAAVRDSEMRPAWSAYLWPAAALVVLLVALWGSLPYLGHSGLIERFMPVAVEPVATESPPPAPTDGMPAMAAPASRQSPEQPSLASANDGLAGVDAAETGPAVVVTGAEEDPPESPVAGDDTESTPPAAAVQELINIVAASSYADTPVSEIENLRAQMQELPPEDIWLDAPDPASTCRLGSSIIYRPLERESL